MTVVSVPVETDTRRDEELSARHLTYLDTEVMLGSEGVEISIRCRIVESVVDIETNAVSHVQQRSDIPSVLSIETKDTELH